LNFQLLLVQQKAVMDEKESQTDKVAATHEIGFKET